MPKRGKKYREAVAKYDKTALFEAPEALKLAVEASHAKFDETVEVHIKLGVDQQMRDFGQASTAIQAFADVLALQK